MEGTRRMQYLQMSHAALVEQCEHKDETIANLTVELNDIRNYVHGTAEPAPDQN